MRLEMFQVSNPVLRYGFALSMVIASILLRYALMPLLGMGYQYVTVFPAIVVIAILAGRGPAVFTAVLASLLAEYYFSPGLNLPDISAITIVVLTGFFIGWLAESFAESEQRFRTMANSIPQLAWIAKADGYIYWYNQRWYEYTGTTPEQMEGWGWQSVHDPQILPSVLERWKGSIATGLPFDMEFPIRGADGVFRSFLTRVMPLKDSHGRVIQWVGTNTDLSARKKAEDALRESEGKFRMLAENAQAIIGIVQGERIVYANPYSERATGYSMEELLNLDFPKLVHPDYRPAMMERARRRQAGEPVESHYEFVMITKHGQQRWLDFSPIMITYRGQPAIVGIAYDITDRKQAEEALRISEEHFRLASESADIGTWDWDLPTDNLIWGPKCRELLGVGPDSESSLEIFMQCTHPDDRNALSQAIEKTLSGKSVYGAEFRVIWPDASVHWLLTKGKPFFDADGKPVRLSGIIMDITRQKNYEEQLEAANNQLEDRSKELETIIGIVSHDLRAPLVNVRGFAKEIDKDIEILHEMIGKESATQPHEFASLFEDFTQSTRFISSSAEAMDNLAKSLVNVARAGLAAIQPEKLNMNEIIKNVMLSIQFKFKQSRVKYDIASNLPHCIGDKTQITQIFTNIIDNAVKYLDPDRPGQICIDGCVDNGSALYRVADNGIGIASEDQEKIFDPYYQIHEKAAEGVGMGLATVKRMLDRNNARIWVDSEKGKGSTFYIALPMHP